MTIRPTRNAAGRPAPGVDTLTAGTLATGTLATGPLAIGPLTAGPPIDYNAAMKILYFAWLRERVGHAEEDIAPPAEIATVGALTDWLAAQSPRHATAFAERRTIRVAVDQVFVPDDQPIAGAREIAYFPPFTGG